MKARSIFLFAILCWVSFTAFAAIEPSDGVSRSASSVTLSADYEEYTISGSESGVSIIVQSGVKRLLLDDAEITAPDNQTALTAKGSLTLHISGTSTITGGSGSAGSDGGTGILSQGETLTVSGSGRLNVKGGSAGDVSGYSAPGKNGGTAIEANLVLTGGALEARGGNASNGAEAYQKEGGNGGIGGDAIKGNVTASGGTLAASGGIGGIGGEHYPRKYDEIDGGNGGNGGNAISGDLDASGSVRVTAIGGNGGNGNFGEYFIQYAGFGGNAIGGSLKASGSAVVIAKGGDRGQLGRQSELNDPESGHGIFGNAIVQDDASVSAEGGSAGDTYYSIHAIASHGVNGNVQVNGGRLTAKGGIAEKSGYSTSSKNQGGKGINGSAAIRSGRLIATGGSASGAPRYNTGGDGIGGAFTITGGYALVKGGEGERAMGRAVGSGVSIGQTGRLLIASVGLGVSPDTPLNGGEFYTSSADITASVSGMRSFESKEQFAVSYVCAYDGCQNSYTDYADGFAYYKAKTPEAIGFQDHGLVFDCYIDADGDEVSGLTLTGPLALKAVWKTVFTFAPGEGGTGVMPERGVRTSGAMAALPECGFTAPDGYRFAGWMIDGDDRIYEAGETIPAAGHIHLTAAWEPIPALPATGDSAMLHLWMVLCLGSCALLLFMRARARR